MKQSITIDVFQQVFQHGMPGCLAAAADVSRAEANAVYTTIVTLLHGVRDTSGMTTAETLDFFGFEPDFRRLLEHSFAKTAAAGINTL